MTAREDIESAWRVSLPEKFVDLYAEFDWNAVRMASGTIMKVCYPILSPKEIVGAFELREDWQLPEDFVPMIGDFHDLIGLDYSHGEPRVVALNDAREVVPLFDDFDAFLAARCNVDETEAGSRRIDEGQSWLDL